MPPRDTIPRDSTRAIGREVGGKGCCRKEAGNSFRLNVGTVKGCGYTTHFNLFGTAKTGRQQEQRTGMRATRVPQDLVLRLSLSSAFPCQRDKAIQGLKESSGAFWAKDSALGVTVLMLVLVVRFAPLFAHGR